MTSATLAAVVFVPNFHVPQDFNTNFLMVVRWIHFLAGITWIGLLYFFNLVNGTRRHHQGQGPSRPHDARAVVVPHGRRHYRARRPHLLGEYCDL
jgi:hypothetical protein